MKTINEYRAEQMSDPDFARAYEDIQPEMNAIRATVEAGTSRNLKQKESSPSGTGIAQLEISKLERVTRNPSI